MKNFESRPPEPEAKDIYPYLSAYDPEWDYNPGELLRLAVWHKKVLPTEAVGRIKTALDDILGRDIRGGQWNLDQKEFTNLVTGYAQCQTIPPELEEDIVEIIREYKKKQAK